MTESLAPAPFARVAIVGVGLIGGSIAAALHRRAPQTRVIGVGRSAEKLKPLLDRGWLHETSAEISLAAKQADLVIFCTPVDRIVAGIREAATTCAAGTVLTDAGSVKGEICRQLAGTLPGPAEFLGGHPLAGSEKTGFEFAQADLYQGRVCVLTPNARNSAQALDRLKGFWERLGAKVLVMTPEAHDQALAETSHLPHLIASVLASTLSDQNRPLTATGFRDTTRIAAGDADLWTAIFLQNADAVLNRLEAFNRIQADFREALQQRDAAALRRLLVEGKQKRDSLVHQFPDSAVSTEAS